jgi:chromate transporter
MSESQHDPSSGAAANSDGDTIPFREAWRVWGKVALYSFGGPAGQIAAMHRIVVEERRWVSETRFLHALNYCMLLPGPEAQQLATYLGWLMHRTRGALVAGLLFILPGFLSILALSYLYVGLRDLTLVAGIFFGLKPAVLAVVVEAVVRIGRRALGGRVPVAIAAISFLALFVGEISFPIVIAASGLAGLLIGRVAPEAFRQSRSNGSETHEGNENGGLARGAAGAARPSAARFFRVAAIFAVLWGGPVAACMVLLGRGHVFTEEAIFFSKMAVVTFGGAYAVLAYMAQAAVQTHGWVTAGQMLDGLGLAETTPGPLIQVVQFVGFLGAYQNPGGLHPLVAATAGAVLATWVTFVPSFFWIFLGAPYAEALRGRKSLDHALSAITAAVVGAVLSLALWFALHTIFGEVAEVHRFGGRWLIPEWGTLSVGSLVIAAGAFALLFGLKRGMFLTLGAGAVAGIAFRLLGIG